MKVKEKSLCKLIGNKILKKDLEAYLELVTNPSFVCTNCGRVAAKKNNLCKPRKI